jgi:hypothetical protein
MGPDAGPEHEAALLDILRRTLGLTGKGRLEDRSPLEGVAAALRPDRVYREGRRTVLVYVLDRASAADIAMAKAARDVLAGRARKKEQEECIVLARRVPAEVAELARALGVPVARLAWDAPVPRDATAPRAGAVRLSSDKAWRVASTLLATGPASVRALAGRAGVSYGWAHRVVGRLIDLHIASRTPQGIAVDDVDALLKGIAWERDVQKLRVAELPVAGDDVVEAARAVQSELDSNGILAAFTAITAGGIYTGHSMRFDTLYAYVDLRGRYSPSGRPARGHGLYTSGDNLVKWNVGAVRRMVEDPGGRVRLSVHLPDRDVFEHAEERLGLRLVSPAQALLDLAGMGFGAWELAKEMVTVVRKADG